MFLLNLVFHEFTNEVSNNTFGGLVNNVNANIGVCIRILIHEEEIVMKETRTL
jgi:hypothetical protein